MADFFQRLQADPMFQQGLQTLRTSGMTPQDLLAEAQMQAAQSQMMERERKAQREQAFQEVAAGIDWQNMTPESMAELAKYADPDQMLRIYENVRKAQQAKIENDFFYGTGEGSTGGGMDFATMADGDLVRMASHPSFGPSAQAELLRRREDSKYQRELDDKANNPTEAQAKAVGFLDRMQEADSVLDEVGDNVLADPKQAALGAVPLAGNFLVDEDYQRARQAQENWVRANLRKESGAVIGEEEMAREIATYFPKPGDSPKVIEQKRKAREAAKRGMRTSAGAAGERVSKPNQANANVADWRSMSDEQLMQEYGISPEELQ